jgi:thiol-disulfide isomerase/thioredoxin
MKKDNIITIGLIVLGIVLLVSIFMLCKPKSSFQASTQSKGMTDKSEAPLISKDSVVVVYADWCGHCKNFKPDMEKAARQSSKVVLLNSDTPEGKKFMKENNVNGFPSVVQNGKTLNIPRTADALVAVAEGEKD